MRVRVEAKAVAMQQLEYLNAFKMGFVEAPDRSYVASKPFASYEQAQSHLLDIAYQYVAKSDKRTFSEMEADVTNFMRSLALKGMAYDPDSMETGCRDVMLNDGRPFVPTEDDLPF